VLPDDVQTVAGPVLEHRLIIEPRARLAGSTPESVLADALIGVAVPTEPGADAPPGS
jgi:MoxR-like ATPase